MQAAGSNNKDREVVRSKEGKNIGTSANKSCLSKHPNYRKRSTDFKTVEVAHSGWQERLNDIIFLPISNLIRRNLVPEASNQHSLPYEAPFQYPV